MTELIVACVPYFMSTVIVGLLSWRAFREQERGDAMAERVIVLEKVVREFVRSELPDAVPDCVNPDEFMMICMTHDELADYSNAIRLAKQVL